MALVGVMGLSFEGGKVVQTYSELASLASSAARLGGQEVVGIQDGNFHIDELAARNVMTKFLRTNHEQGEFVIGSTYVSVTVERTIPSSFSQLFGVSSRKVKVTRTAIIVKG
jgi:hypothetical protein